MSAEPPSRIAGAPARSWKPYRAYKDSGVEWLGKVPEHWEVWKIKHSTYVKGRIGWKGLTSNDFLDEGAYLVTGTDFVDGKVNWETCYHVSYERFDEDPYIQLKEKDILITKDGTIGKIAIAENLQNKATLNSGIFLIRPLTTNYLNDFMYWILNSEVFSTFINYTKTGSTIQHLYQNVFEDFSFPVPLIPEQLSITRYLDDRTQKIDSLIEKKQKLIELLKEERTVVINQAVTKGLDPRAPMRDSGVEWLGKIPKHWEIMQFRRICSLNQGLQKAQSERFYEPGENRFEYITIKSINNPNNPKEYIENPPKSVICNRDDVLLARTGATGEVITNQNGVFHNNFFSVNYDPKRVYKEFLVCYLQNSAIKNHLLMLAGTTTIPDLNHSEFLSTKFLLPPFEEQVKIVAFIESQSIKIDRAASRIEKEIALLQEYRTALISEVVTGKIDVREAI